MQLDFVESTGYFTLRVPRAEGVDIGVLMKQHGLDLSQPASTASTACLITKESYAAAAFGKYATPQARGQLSGILEAIEDSWKDNSNVKIRCPMDRELWPFQRASVAYALQRQNCLVGDQPGLGKTPIGICFANEIQARRVLVLCPANIRLQWVRRIREWTTLPWPYVVYPVLSGRHGVHPQAHWTVVSYDLARTEAIGRALAAGRYDLLILDEAHFCKSIDAGRTHAVFGDHTGNMRRYNKETKKHEVLFSALALRSERILALTGTPLPNRPREAYTLARGLCFDSIDWMSEDKFSQRFNPSARLTGIRAGGTTYTYTREEVGRHSELQNRLRANMMVRHLKAQVMTQLKRPVYDLVRVEETRAVKDAIQAEGMLSIDPDMFECESIEVKGQWAEVRHAMGLAIAPQVAEYAAMCLDGGEDKILIGAWHVDVLNELEARLHKFGVLRIDGSTSAKERERRVQAFQDDPKMQIMLGNTMAIGVGVDGLQQVCSHVLVAEPDPVPGQTEQLVARLDRGGQTGTVQADLFVAPDSLLERILASALHKLDNTHRALDARVA